jgi:hypothetical protein
MIMIMPPALRKFALIVHLTASVGWIGAVIAYLTLVIAAMNSSNDQMVLGTGIAMKVMGWYAIIPFAITSLVTGLIMSLGTKWGLFRHYWVIFSLILTVIAVVILLQHMHPASFLNGVSIDAHSMDVNRLRSGLPSELLHSGVGLVVLVVVQVLNVYKPRGVTPYGWRKQQEDRRVSGAIDTVS